MQATVISPPLLTRFRERQGTGDISLAKDKPRDGDPPAKPTCFGNLCKKGFVRGCTRGANGGPLEDCYDREGSGRRILDRDENVNHSY